MSPARPLYNGDDLFITRRVSRREFRLRPDPIVTKIMTYLLAVLAAKYEIEVHAVCVMGNHWHALVYTANRRIADFTRDFHSFSARHINAVYGDAEAMWNSSQTSHVRPETPEDILRRIEYTMANPVKAGIVEYGHRWRGLRGAFGDKPITVARPNGFFRVFASENEGTFPAEATLTFHPPRCLPGTRDEIAALIAKRVADAETRAREEVWEEGRSFMGMRAVMRQSRHARPTSDGKHDKRGKREKRVAISPRVACVDQWRRIERLAANKEWVLEHNRCRDRFRQGERDVVFPYGTYKMSVVHGVNVAPPPT